MALTPSTMLPLGHESAGVQVAERRWPDGFAGRFQIGPGAAGGIFICNHCPFVKHVAAGVCAIGAGLSGERGGGGGHQFEQPGHASGRFAGADGARSGKPRLHVSVSCSTKRRTWPKPTARPARPIFMCSTRTRSSSTAARWTTAGPTPAFRSPAAICAPRSTPCWPASRLAEKQKPSIGCNIKWKAGSEPDYFGHVKV